MTTTGYIYTMRRGHVATIHAVTPGTFYSRCGGAEGLSINRTPREVTCKRCLRIMGVDSSHAVEGSEG